MVIIFSSQHIDVKCDSSSHRKRVEHMRQHFSGQFTNLFSFESKISNAEGAARNINNGSGKCLGRELTDLYTRQWVLKGLTSSRGAKPVPYRLMPLTSPSAALKADPRARALSCTDEVSTWGQK
jgi:hypothetical protein